MGRRSEKDDTERRTMFIGFQVTPSERATLDERAAAAGLRMSDYVRAAVLGYRVHVKNPVTERALSELWAIGNNLNQLAKHANTTGELATGALTKALDRWHEIVQRLHD